MKAFRDDADFEHVLAHFSADCHTLAAVELSPFLWLIPAPAISSVYFLVHRSSECFPSWFQSIVGVPGQILHPLSPSIFLFYTDCIALQSPQL